MVTFKDTENGSCDVFIDGIVCGKISKKYGCYLFPSAKQAFLRLDDFDVQKIEDKEREITQTQWLKNSIKFKANTP